MKILENKRSRVVNNIKSIRNKKYIKREILLKMMNSIEKNENFIKDGKVG